MMHCYKCGAEIPPHYADACKVTQLEKREYHELRVGELLCVMCWHATKYPSLMKNRYDDETMPEELMY